MNLKKALGSVDRKDDRGPQEFECFGRQLNILNNATFQTLQAYFSLSDLGLPRNGLYQLVGLVYREVSQ